jgi:hypothetical protein
MLRCALFAAAVLACTVAAAPAAAQAPRNFPATALRGELVVTAPPEVLLNKQPARLAPGARIRGTDNMLVMSGAAVNQRLLVHYTLDLQGQMLEVWVLTPAEAARKPWPVSPQEAASWRFDPSSQTWSKP